VRGDAVLTFRLLLRQTGAAGLVTAVGGTLVITGVVRPWHVVVAEVSMLGSESSRTVASSGAFPGTVTGWLAGSLGVLILALGVLLALDRPPRRGRALAAGLGGILAVVAVAAMLMVPAADEIARDTTEQLVDVAGHLPLGVALELRTTAGSGPWWVLAGAATAIIGAVGARET
jgi:drug/metabolite transporter superfamily protein YnfA